MSIDSGGARFVPTDEEAETSSYFRTPVPDGWEEYYHDPAFERWMAESLWQPVVPIPRPAVPILRTPAPPARAPAAASVQEARSGVSPPSAVLPTTTTDNEIAITPLARPELVHLQVRPGGMGTVVRGLMPSAMATGPVRVVPLPVALTGGAGAGSSGTTVVNSTTTTMTTRTTTGSTGAAHRPKRGFFGRRTRGRKLAMATCAILLLGVVFVIVLTTVMAIEKSEDGGEGESGPPFVGWEQGG